VEVELTSTSQATYKAAFIIKFA